MVRTLVPVFIVLLLCTAGCGKKTVKVEVEVTRDGKPVEGASVTFHPSDSNRSSASGVTDRSGKAVLQATVSSGRGQRATDGVEPGDYKVTVTRFPRAATGKEMKPDSPEAAQAMANQAQAGPPVSELGEKYATPTSTPLTAKVPSNSYTFDIK